MKIHHLYNTATSEMDSWSSTRRYGLEFFGLESVWLGIALL